MRLIGILVTLAVLGYTSYIYLGGSSDSASTKPQPVEYVDQAKQSADAINEAMKKQQEQLQEQLHGTQ